MRGGDARVLTEVAVLTARALCSDVQAVSALLHVCVLMVALLQGVPGPQSGRLPGPWSGKIQALEHTLCYHAYYVIGSAAILVCRSLHSCVLQNGCATLAALSDSVSELVCCGASVCSAAVSLAGRLPEA